MPLDLESLSKSLNGLHRSLLVVEQQEVITSDADLLFTLRSGVIQNFEVAYEQCWKMIKRWLEENMGNSYVEGVTRRELFRLAAEHHLIFDVEKWMEYHYARNNTSHIYDAEIADEVYSVAKKFSNDASKLLTTLVAKND